MKIYRRAHPTNGPTQLVSAVGVDMRDWPESYRRILQRNDGSPMAASWTPLPAVFVYDLEAVGAGLIAVDLPMMVGFVFLLRPAALGLLSERLSPYGEFLPIECDEDELVGFHCTNVIDALDMERSNVSRFDDDDRVLHTIYDAQFRAGTIGDNEVFCVPQDPGYVFFSESFVDWFSTLGLTGAGWYCKAEVEP